MPTTNPTILLTRPRTASESFARELSERLDRPVNIVIAPLFEIEPVGALVDTSPWPTLIFTSSNAIPRTLPSPGKPAYCVGDATAEVAAHAGFAPVSAGGDADDLFNLIISHRPDGPILHLRGAHGTSLSDRLKAAGLDAEEAVVYRQSDTSLSNSGLIRIQEAEGRVITPVFSPRSARRLREYFGPEGTLTVVAMSRAVAESWGAPAHIAEAPTAKAMLDAVARALDSDSPY